MAAEDHEVYQYAPIALVVVEITFPGDSGSPVPAGAARTLSEGLGDEWVIEQVQMPRIAVELGGAQALGSGSSSLFGGAILRFVDRERTTALAVTAQSVTVETTRYGNWPQFRSTLETAIGAAEKLLRPTGIRRAGMRYIDEVRVAGVQDSGWSEWLSPTVLPPAWRAMVDARQPPAGWTGVANYQIGEDRTLTLRYGAQSAQPGFAVNPDGPLRRLGPRPTGPFFLLDFDASWQPAVVPRWDSGRLLRICDELRQPIRGLFDQIVTERLVEEVFKKKEDD